MVLADVAEDGGVNHVKFFVVAYFGAADVVQWGVDYADAFGVLLGYGDVAAWTAVDKYGAKTDDVGCSVPAVKPLPVVGSDDECELEVGILADEFGEGGMCERRYGQVTLKVGHMDAFDATACKARHAQAVGILLSIIRRSIGISCLQWVLGAYHQPYFVNESLVEQRLGKAHMACVDGVERTSVDGNHGKGKGEI